MVAAEHIDDVPQLFNFIEVSRHRIGGWFHHVPGFGGLATTWLPLLPPAFATLCSSP
jgi:hypothetical protein